MSMDVSRPLEERLSLDDSYHTIAFKMSDGNPGAISAVMNLLKMEDGMFNILLLDNWGIYGTGIYVLYNDHCGRDVEKFAKLINATRHGKFDLGRLKRMAADQSRSDRITEEEWKAMQ